ncbi:hypothetical protein C6380_05145 [Pseudomonas syringae pv. actinidiae]|uniref:multiubiquitin domain-containing protein n=1 Tax=Pseudomonas syringae TaxID=317 RepID=UPI000BB543D7|nr:multiubiquitin domain-containing protein [Pseudomonas syringae]PBK51311.1 hypothetical protein BUE61_17630 [Pseudomonas syringae pv. actinidiae]PBK51879.1 hypothetical protein BUE60_17855 [Pseudomonas syringae pv. actinidiae]RJX54358.1 hypothetical protein C6379_16005 [Pseudomonas syringae pv. actinidiae]RJX60188.1 hypothetical protein C6380_05145 [Pseudomonas syringae pv. actinidiae]RJX60313.1 hypothetical protein C6383_13740 [Pseudomonas syringae pv. actinidiae]
MSESNVFEAEDVSAAVQAGRPVRDHGPYSVLIGDEALRFVGAVINDPVVTGSQILALARIRNAVEHQVFQILVTGRLEEISPDESVDLRAAGAEKFIVFESDSSYRMLVNDQSLEWGARQISGATLKTLAGVDVNDFDVWEVIVGGKDNLIGNKEFVDLTKPGVERFATKRFEAHIVVNAKPKIVHARSLSYRDLVELAFPGSPHPANTVYTIDYDNGPHESPEGSVVDGQHVHVKEGMEFYVIVSDQS